MKNLLFAMVLLASNLAQAQDAQIKHRLVNMFKVAGSPMTANDSFLKQQERYQGIERSDDYLTRVNDGWSDWDFCMDEKLGWSLIPMSAKKLSRMVNANHKRCSKYRVDSYPASVRLKMKHLPKDELLLDLPSIAAEVVGERNHVWRLALGKTLKRSVVKPHAILSRQAENSNLSPMEVCAAVALTEVMEQFNNDIDESFKYYGDRLGKYTHSDTDFGMDAYNTRLKFLAMTVGDWWVRTKGNSALCPNFGLELKVEELGARVAKAERKIALALSQNADLRHKVEQLNKRMDKNEMMGVAGFLTFGFIGYRMLTPM